MNTMNTISTSSLLRALISVFFASLDIENANEELNVIKQNCRNAISATLQTMAVPASSEEADAIIDEYLYARVR